MENWIKVSDRLPKPGPDVLVTDGDACMVATYSTVHSKFRFFGTPHWESDNVTHWMPLPETPKD